MWADVSRKVRQLKIERMYQLPIAGVVVVNEGQSVSTGDLIAEARMPGNLQTIDIARGLGLPAEEASQCILRSIGEVIEEEDLFAQSERTLTRLIRMPFKGRLVDFCNGKAIFATGESKIQVRSTIRGFVEKVIPEYGALISTTGSLLQGIWGNGKSGEGELNFFEINPESLSDKSPYESITSGQIIIVSAELTGEILEELLKRELCGLVCFSVESNLIGILERMALPVIILQGFGKCHPDPESIAILKSRAGDLGCINGVRLNRHTGEYPELIIPGGEGVPEKKMGAREKLILGQTIQVLSGNWMGEIGEIVGLPEDEITFDSGLVGLCAEVQFTNEDIVRVPRSNLLIFRD